MEEQKEIRRHFSGIGRNYFIFTVISFAAQIAVIKLVRQIRPQLFTNTAVSLIISMIPLYCIAAPVLVLLMRRLPVSLPVRDPADDDRRRMKPGQFIACLVMTFSAMYIGNLIGLALTGLIGALKGSAVTNSAVELITGTNMWGTVLIAVIIAPVVEELLFRKLLIDRVVRYGEGVAVLLSGLMFGLFHGNLNQFFYAFFIGMMFAFVYVKTGNIKYTILMHMILNFFGSVVAMLVLRSVDLEALEALALAAQTGSMDAAMTGFAKLLPSLLIYGAYCLFLLGVLLTGIILFLLSRKKFTLEKREWTVQAKEKSKLILGNVGMLLYFVVWVILIVTQFLQ